MINKKSTTVLLALLCATFSTGAFAATIKECVEANQAATKAVDADHAEALKAKEYSAADIATINKSHAALMKTEASLAKGGLTLAECQEISKDIAAFKKEIDGLKSGKNQVAACMAENRAATLAVDKDHAEALKDKEYGPAQIAMINKSHAALMKTEADLAKGGLTLAECKTISKDIAMFRAEVDGLKKDKSKGPAEIVACVNANRAATLAVDKDHAEALKEKEYGPAQIAMINKSHAALMKTEADLAKGGLTLAECKTISKDIAMFRAEVDGLKSAKVVVKACMEKNAAAHKKLVADYAIERKDRMTNKIEDAEFAKAEQDLAKLEATVAKGGITPTECAEVSKAIASEQARFDKLQKSKIEILAKGGLKKKTP